MRSSPKASYSRDDLNWMDKTSRSTIEMNDKKARPEIIKGDIDISHYEKTYIGYPVWWYTAPTIINTFLEAYDFSGKTVIFFATSGGSTIDKANEEFKAAYPKINWKAGQTLNGASEEDIKTWVASLQ